MEPPPRQPPPRISAYGTVNFTQTAPLLANMARLAGGAAVNAEWPDIMEEYGQRCSLMFCRFCHLVMDFDASWACCAIRCLPGYSMLCLA